MRKSIIFLFLCLSTIGCKTLEIDNSSAPGFQYPKEYLAFTDSYTQTKVFVNSSLTTLWNADDRITIFNDTYNAQWKFNGETGADNGTFSKVQKEDEFYTGADIPTTYAVYPYNPSTSITTKGEITLTLPAVQHYAQNSYGLGANTMVAATKSPSSNALYFKSLCSFVVIKLYGSGSVKSITLTGNNGEKLAGTATVKPVYGEAPSAVMSSSATTSITLDCGDGVALGSTEGTATEFWFCIPPTTFSKGFTIKATNTQEYYMEKVTSSEKVFERNTKYAMAAIEGVFDKADYVPFEDANFKAYCVENFDKDGDGEINYWEAKLISSIWINPESVESISGIEYFTNLRTLTCRLNYMYCSFAEGSGHYHYYVENPEGSQKEIFSKLKNVDISKNDLLERIDFTGCGFTSLDVSKNTALTQLNCDGNQLTALDVSKNTALTSLDCDGNKLATLDVSKNTALTTLHCWHNQLTTLDVSKNTALTELHCYGNQLSALDVSKNTALTSLDCSLNPIASLDVRNNVALTRLSCGPQLTALDVSNNTALTRLSCGSNQFTDLDVSKNTKLTYLSCPFSKLTSLDVTNNVALESLICGSNKLNGLDISKNTALKTLNCNNNNISTIYVWEGFDPSKLDIVKDDSASFVVKKAPVFEAVDLGLSVKWANWNLGAKSESDYGDFYAWGETSPKTSFTWANYSLCNGTNKTLKKYNKDSEYGTVDNKTRLESSDDAASVRLGGAWRIPTSQEWDELKNKCTWTWTTVSGVSGYLVTSNKSGYEDKSIFLPIGGGYDQYNIGKTTTNWGLYWTSDVYDLHYDWAYGFNFTSGTIGACGPGRSWGYVIRPVCQN